MAGARARNSSAPLQMWGGVEPTVNRVGDQYFEQMERSGHARPERITDLDLFAGLGIRALRYPVLWERTAPDGLERADWRWSDARLSRLREFGVNPIVGLVHHGSGPRSTSLVDPAFPERLAEYAGAVARRYPWVEDYTPVNEPLTTARFSGLYGLWYPHGLDHATFLRTLLTQCRGVVLAMRAIREVNSAARLIQTDDLGKVFSTPPVAYQAEHENERRWLTWDLLCGRVGRQHALWNYLRESLPEADLLWFQENACPPDVIGLNHYLTSERFLDHRLERYSPEWHGGNGRDRYADVLAVRVLAGGQAGPRVLLNEAWERFRLPLAITEAHNGCTREEQLRWLLDVWNAAEGARAEGADVRAVTVWSLLGAFDWNSLVTVERGFYEPGVFDIRSSAPRPTAIASLVRDLANGRQPDHPVLASPGWWRRPERFQHPPVRLQAASGTMLETSSSRSELARPLLITGARGTLGKAFARICDVRGLPYFLLSRDTLDIADPGSVEAAVAWLKPWAVINAAGFVRVDDAEEQEEACFRENTHGPAVLAEVCARYRARLVTMSSDLVFDGGQTTPYIESSPVNPLNVYGRSKAEAESWVLSILPSALVVRTSAFFGPWDAHNFVGQALRTLADGRTFVAADDQTVSPTYVPDLVQAVLDLLIDGEGGTWHVANQGAATWADLARLAATNAGLDAHGVEGRPTEALGLPAPRPRYSVLGSERAWIVPSLEDALSRYLDACEGSWVGEPDDPHRQRVQAVTRLIHSHRQLRSRAA